MFAVIRTGGKQYRVAAEDTLTVGRLEGNPGDVIEITDVLAYGEGDNATIGTPTVEGVTIAAEIVSQGRHKTVIAFKKRRRQNSRRKRGQRQHETVLRISEILTGGKKPAARTAQAETETASEAAPAKKPRAKKAAETAAATE